MKKYLSVSAFIIGLSIATAVPAFALTVDTNVTGSANANSNYSSSSSQTGVSAGVNVTTGTNATTNTQGTVSITASSQVSNDTDLDAYSLSVKQRDSAVTEVSSDDTSVSVNYKLPAKLFGFIKINMTETASVEVQDENKTEVYVSRPWWSVFARAEDHSEAFAARIKSRIPSSVTASASANTDVKLSAITKAQFISAIEASAKETFSTSASAEASASGSVQY